MKTFALALAVGLAAAQGAAALQVQTGDAFKAGLAADATNAVAAAKAYIDAALSAGGLALADGLATEVRVALDAASAGVSPPDWALGGLTAWGTAHDGFVTHMDDVAVKAANLTAALPPVFCATAGGWAKNLWQLRGAQSASSAGGGFGWGWQLQCTPAGGTPQVLLSLGLGGGGGFTGAGSAGLGGGGGVQFYAPALQAALRGSTSSTGAGAATVSLGGGGGGAANGTCVSGVDGADHGGLDNLPVLMALAADLASAQLGCSTLTVSGGGGGGAGFALPGAPAALLGGGWGFNVTGSVPLPARAGAAPAQVAAVDAAAAPDYKAIGGAMTKCRQACLPAATGAAADSFWACDCPCSKHALHKLGMTWAKQLQC